MWRGLTGERRHEALLTEVRGAAARVLGGAPESVAPHRPLADIGIDSLRAVAFRTDLEHRLGVVLPPTLLWNRPAAADIAAYVAERAGADTEEEDSLASRTVPAARAGDRTPAPGTAGRH
jgi:acyl carrier protein